MTARGASLRNGEPHPFFHSCLVIRLWATSAWRWHQRSLPAFVPNGNLRHRLRRRDRGRTLAPNRNFRTTGAGLVFSCTGAGLVFSWRVATSLGHRTGLRVAPLLRDGLSDTLRHVATLHGACRGRGETDDSHETDRILCGCTLPTSLTGRRTEARATNTGHVARVRFTWRSKRPPGGLAGSRPASTPPIARTSPNTERSPL